MGWAGSAAGPNPRNLSGVKRAQKSARAWGRFLQSRRARAKTCGQIHAAVDRLPQLGEAGKLVARHGIGVTGAGGEGIPIEQRNPAGAFAEARELALAVGGELVAGHGVRVRPPAFPVSLVWQR